MKTIIFFLVCPVTKLGSKIFCQIWLSFQEPKETKEIQPRIKIKGIPIRRQIITLSTEQLFIMNPGLLHSCYDSS